MFAAETWWQKIVWLSLAGAAGTLARCGLTACAYRLTGPGYPWGTLAVNGIGCFCFGLVWALAEQRLMISPQARLIVLAGFMGAFTTFSTYAFETSQLMRDAEWLAVGANLLAQNVLGLSLAILGFVVGRAV